MPISRLPLWALAFVALVQPALGQRFDYASVYSGWVFLNDYEGGNVLTPSRGTFDDGWLLGGAVGKCLNNCNRFEMEFFYRNNRGNQWSGPLGTAAWDGRLNSFSSMANLLHDFRGLQGCYTTPYAGAGAGAAYLEGEFSTPAADYRLDDTVFAYQGILGLRTQLTCRTSLLTEYRYFGTSNARLTNNLSAATLGTLGYDSHNAMIGLSISR